MSPKKRVLSAIAPLLLLGWGASAGNAVAAPAMSARSDAARTLVFNIRGSKSSMESADWARFMSLWLKTMKDYSGRGVRFTLQQGEPRNSGESGTLVVVDVANYRYLSSVAWYGNGAMSATAFIQARVSFLDLKTGEPWAEKSYDTLGNVWQDVSFATTTDQINAICKEIAARLSRL